MRRQTIKDFKNINEIVQSNDAIKTKACRWESLFEKYSNTNDKEEDGVFIEDHVKILEAEDPSLDDNDEIDEPHFYNSEDEAEVDLTEDTSKTLSVAEFQKMSQKQRFNQLTYVFSPELLRALKKVFDQKVAEVERMNLPFWNFTSEKSRVEELLNEDFFHTPTSSFGSRRYHRSTEIDRCQFNATPSIPKLMLNKVKINGLPSILEHNTDSNELPLPIRQLLEMNSNVTIKIREREYDIQVGKRNGFGLTDGISKMRMLQDAPTLENIKVGSGLENDCIYVESSSGDENIPDNIMTGKLTKIDKGNLSKTDRKKNEVMLTTADKKTVEKSRVKKFKNDKAKGVRKTVQKKRVNPIAPSSDSEEEQSKPRFKSKQLPKNKLTSKAISNDKPQQEKPEQEKPQQEKPQQEKPQICQNVSSEVLQPFKTLTLDDISCGSSCLETSSDEGFFNINKYQMLRGKAQLQHKQKKLFERTQLMENNESLMLQSRTDEKQSAPNKNSFDTGSSLKKSTDDRNHDTKLDGRKFDVSSTKIRRLAK